MSKNRRFKTLSGSHPKWSPIQAMMDEAYRAQVREHEVARMRVKSKKFYGKGDGELSPEELERTIDHYENAFLKYCTRVSGRPMLAGLGSARNASVCQMGLAMVNAIADQAVPQSVGIATGEWHAGFMGAFKHAWLTRKQAFDKDWAYSCAVPLMGQEISELHSDPDVPDWYLKLREEAIAPPHATFVARTLAIVGPPQTVGCLYTKPGLGTKEEFARIRLERQMRKRNLSIYTWRPSDEAVPPDFVLDTPRIRRPDKWTWDSLLQETEMQLEEGSVSETEFQDLFVLRIGKPTDSQWKDTPVSVNYFDTTAEMAEFVMDKAWACHMSLRVGLSAELNDTTNGNGGTDPTNGSNGNCANH